MIHFHDRAVVTADGRQYPHDGSAADRRRAISEAQADIALHQEASNRRSIAERGRPCTPSELANGWKPDDLRGPHEQQADSLALTSQYNPYQARLDILKSQRIFNCKEIPALEAKAAAWTPPVNETAAPESPYDVAIASLLAKPGHLPEEKAATDRQVALLRAAGDKWRDDQARQAEATARANRPEFVNAEKNAEATHRAAQLLANVPQSHVDGCKARMLALRETGDVEKYFAETKAAEKLLDAHFDSIDQVFDQRKKQNELERAAATSRAPVELPTPPPAAPPSLIEQALMPKPPETPAP